jgi:hypothetical protein
MGVQPDAPTIETIIPLRFTSSSGVSPKYKGRAVFGSAQRRRGGKSLKAALPRIFLVS